MSNHIAIGSEQRICEQHGPYESTQWDRREKPQGYPNLPGSTELAKFLDPFWSRCPSCDSELQREVDAQHAAIRSGKLERDRMLAAKFAEAKIPKSLQGCTFETFLALLPGQKTALSAAKDFAYGFADNIENGTSLVFLGRPGNGKSHLAVAALRHVVLKGGRALYTTVFDIMLRVKSTFSKQSHETEEQAIAHFVSPDLLVIDEIGKQTNTDFEQAHFFALINKRYSERKPMVLVANLDEAQFKALLGDAVIDRLRDRGGRLVRFNWDSHRGQE